MQAFNAKLEFLEQPMSCDMSPADSLLAVGLVSGQLSVHSYAYEAGAAKPITSKAAWSVEAHGQSCRTARFTLDGHTLVSGGEDRAIKAFDVETHKQVWLQDAAHDSGVSMLRVFTKDPTAGQQGAGAGKGHSLLVSGEEEGGVKLWDLRTRKQAMAYKKHTDYISDAALHTKEFAMVITSGDGTISIHDLRTNKFRARSETDADDELLSCCVVKNGKKVIAGTQSGVLAIYSWGYFNDCSDRFPGHPESVDAVVVFDEDTVLTGSSDGMVRVVGVLPNKLLGVVGAHEEFPIEHLAISTDRRVLASSSHDNTVRLWDLSILHDEDDGDEEEEEGGEEEEWEEVQGGEEGEGVAAGEASGSGTGEEEEEEEEEWSSLDGEDEDGSGSGSSEGEEGEAGSGSASDEAEEREQAGASDEGEEEDEEAAQAGPSNPTVAAKGGKGGAGQKALGPVGAGKPAVGVKSSGGQKFGKLLAQSGQGKAVGSEDGSGDDSDDDSDSDGDKKKGKKRKQREKTKWTKGKNQKTKNNFFADLL